MKLEAAAVVAGALSLSGGRALIQVMKTVVAPRRLAALLLIALTLALPLQLTQARPGMVIPGPAESMLMLMSEPLHCDGCSEASLMPDCADGLCGGLTAMACGGALPAAETPPRAVHAHHPLYHPGPDTGPEPQPPRMPIPV